MTPIFEIGQLVTAKNKTTYTKWRVLEREPNARGQWRYYCKASSDSPKQFGFSALYEDFKEEELEEM